MSIALALTLSACGGGGGGGGGTSSAPAPVPVFNYTGFDFRARGIKSTPADAEAALYVNKSPQKGWPILYTIEASPTGHSLEATHTRWNTFGGVLFLPIASRDTGAKAAWTAGWTGKGVKIGITGLHQANTFDHHGSRMSLIANSVAPEATITLTSSGFAPSVAIMRGYWQTLHSNQHFIIADGAQGGRTARVSTAFGVELNTMRNNNESYTSGRVGTTAYDAKTLFVFGVFEDKGQCTNGIEIYNCLLSAAVTHGLRAKGTTAATAAERAKATTAADLDAMIWVGALNYKADPSTTTGDTIHNGSLTAGEDMKNDFIVAYNDLLSANDRRNNVVYPDYAAARVAGAAALVRHKFPSLTGKQLKAVLLETATDLGVAGADPIYGRGKLNLAGALSPLGALTAD